MKNIGLRVLSIILAATLLISTMSTAVFAADSVQEEEEDIVIDRGATVLAEEDFEGFDPDDPDKNTIAYDEETSLRVRTEGASRLEKVDKSGRFFVATGKSANIKADPSNGDHKNVVELPSGFQFGISEYGMETAGKISLSKTNPPKLRFEFDLWKYKEISITIRYGNPNKTGRVFALNSADGVTVYKKNSDGTTTAEEYALEGVVVPTNKWVHYSLSLDLVEKKCVLYMDGEKVTAWTLADEWPGEFMPDFTFQAAGSNYRFCYLDNIKASTDDYGEMLDALGGGTAAMTFGRNILKDGKITPLDPGDMITKDEDGDIAPYTFFEKVLDATVSAENGRVNIILGEETFDVTNYSVTYGKDSYLRLAETLAAIGKNSQTFDMVTIIADNENINQIKNDESLIKDLKLALNENQLFANEVTADDWKLVKDRWRQSLLGDGNAVMSDPDVQTKLNSLRSTALNTRATMKKDRTDGIRALFGDASVEKSSSVTSQYNKLLDIALAYGTEGTGTDVYQNESVKEDILYGLEWLYNNLYGENMKKGSTSGWLPAGTNLNSWDFMVGAPTALCKILMIVEDELSKDDIDKYLTALDYSLDHWGNKAANRIYTKTAAAALREDFDDMVARNADYDAMLATASSGTGVREDGMYITHSYYAYSSAYGVSTLLDRVVKIESILSGTKFEFSTPYKYNSCEWIYKTFAPIIFNGAITSAFSGRWRTDNFSEPLYTRFVVAAMLDLIGTFGKDDDAKMKEIIKRNVVAANKTSVINGLDVNQVSRLNEILNDESIVVNPYEISHVYYSGDGAVHQKDDYGFALAMSSSRIAAWESIGGDNQTGWYQGDGLLLLHLKDDINQYNLSYWNNVNPYHLPGTTVDTQTRTAYSIESSKITLTGQDFVGGVTLDEEYSTAAMQLKAHNNLDATLGPVHQSSLMAKKAWFMFDDEVVALGADIDANDGFEVQTVVENRKFTKSEGTGANQIIGAETITVDGETLEKATTYAIPKTFEDPTWVNIEGTAGYYFPNGGDLKIDKVSRVNNYLEMWLSHGVSPTDGTYAYVTLPKKTANETREYSENPDIKILVNNEYVQSVRENKLGVTGTVFWKAGAFNHMTASQPMIVMSENKDGKFKVNVSDPTKKLKTATLKLDGVYTLESGDGRLSLTSTESETTIAIDFEGANGRALPIVLKTVKGPEVVSELKIESTYPVDNAKRISVDDSFTAVFNDDLQGLDKSAVSVTDGTSAPNYKVSVSGKTLMVTFPDGLEYGKNYTVTLKSNIKSIDGISLGEDTSVTFSTVPFDERLFADEIAYFDFDDAEKYSLNECLADDTSFYGVGNTETKIVNDVAGVDNVNRGQIAQFTCESTNHFGISTKQFKKHPGYVSDDASNHPRRVKLEWSMKRSADKAVYICVNGRNGTTSEIALWSSNGELQFADGTFGNRSNVNTASKKGNWVDVALYFDFDAKQYYIHINGEYRSLAKIPEGMGSLTGLQIYTATAGNVMSFDYLKAFGYANPLVIQETSIKNGERTVNPETKVFTATFDKVLKEVDNSSVTVLRVGEGPNPVYNVSKEENVLKIIFPNGFDANTEYSIIIDKTKVASKDDDHLLADLTITFTTANISYSISEVDRSFNTIIAAVDFDNGDFAENEYLSANSNLSSKKEGYEYLLVEKRTSYTPRVIKDTTEGDSNHGLVAKIGTGQHFGLHPDYMSQNNVFYNQATNEYPKLVKVEFEFQGQVEDKLVCEIFVYDEDGAFEADHKTAEEIDSGYRLPWTKYMRVGLKDGYVAHTGQNGHADDGFNKVSAGARDTDWHNLKLYFDFENRVYHSYLDNAFLKTMTIPDTLSEIRGVHIRNYSPNTLYVDKMIIATIDAYAKDTFASSKISDYTFFDGKKSSFVYSNETENSKTINLIRADYDSDGKLVNKSITEVNVPAKKSLLYNLPAITNLSGSYCKYFVWDGFDFMKPLKEAKQINFN